MNVLLVGACGKMGRAFSELAAERGVKLVGIDRSPEPMPFPVLSSLADAPEADVLVDFSSPRGAAERLDLCIKRKIPAVLGTTGWNEDELASIHAAEKKIAVFRTGNFSVGLHVIRRLSERAANLLEGFDAEIVELHHRDKADAPSGTALMLAESVKTGAGGQIAFRRTGARKQGEIGISSVRGGKVVGKHIVLFAGEDEVLTLSHSAESRRVFAAGALRAAAWIIEKPAGGYNMDDLLGMV